MANEKIIVGKCPYCMTVLHIEEGGSVCCPSCDQLVTADDIRSDAKKVGTEASGEAFKDQNAEAIQYAMYIENPTSGLAYLENRFETMNWEEYDTNLVFNLDEISAVVEKNKVTNANNPDTWLLEYKSVAEMIKHKLKGLQKLAEEIKQKYNPVDLTNTFEAFDKYTRLAVKLIGRKEKTYKMLDSDIRFLEKFNAPKETLKAIKEDYETLKTAYDKVEYVKEVKDVPGVDKVIEKAQKDVADELLKEGISAEYLYQEAVANFNDKSGFSSALAKFQKLNGYKDSSKYITKINSLSIFSNVIEANGTLFYAKTVKNENIFSVNAPVETEKKAGNGFGCGKKAQKNQSEVYEPTYIGKTVSIYAIKDCYKEDKPLISNVSAFLTTYNGKLFYINGDKEIKTFDFNSHAVNTLDVGKLGSYATLSETNSKRFVWGADRKSIFIKKRLETRPVGLTKKGCLKRKKAEEPREQLNNFSLLKIDLEQCKATTVIPEFVDIMDVFGDMLFFTQSRDIEVITGIKRGKNIISKEAETVFSSYNLKTGETLDLLDEHAFIVGVENGKVVYSRYSPVTYNMDLFVYDIEKRESLLLEKNIYDTYLIHEGTVLYSVGSFNRRSMFSIKLDGSNRTEILLNVEKIHSFDKNWMYVIKGYSYNKTLIKISYDGKNKVLVASGIDRIIKETAGYIYFIDCFGDLCMVRNDGKELKVITNNCESAKAIVDVDRIFIMAREKMDSLGKVFNTSLYTMDLQGHNLRKLYYGLKDMVEIDEQRIFFTQEEKRKYKVTTPQEKAEPVISYLNSVITIYYSYDKITRDITKLLILGEPKETNFEFKSGCFGKKIKAAHSSIEEITERIEYTRTGKMSEGQVSAESKKKEETAQNTVNPLASAQSAVKGVNNTLLTGCSGCSGTSKKNKK